MAAERLAGILARLSAEGVSDPDPAALCEVGLQVTDATGVGIMLATDGELRGAVCSTDSVSGTLEELQFTYGEGPCVDASRTGRPVAEADLASHLDRWVAFTPPALAAGARAVFGFPVLVASANLGALNLYRDRRGPLDDDQHESAAVLATVIARAFLVLQSEAPAATLAPALEATTHLRRAVHQAAGMVVGPAGDRRG